MIQFKKIEWMEVLHVLEFNEEVAMIIKARFKEPRTRLQDLVRGHKEAMAIRRIELLQQEKDGTRTYFFRMRLGTGPWKSHDQSFLEIGGYLSTPYEIRQGKVTVTYMGDDKQVNEFREFADKSGTPYRVVSLEDAKFPWRTPLGRLTEKQKRVLTLAYRLGYYDIPKKTSIEQLAEILKIAPSTLDVELRRGERRLLVNVLSEA